MKSECGVCRIPVSFVAEIGRCIVKEAELWKKIVLWLRHFASLENSTIEFFCDVGKLFKPNFSHMAINKVFLIF